MASRFVVSSILFCGLALRPNESIPKEAEGKYYDLFLEGDVLEIKEGTKAKFYAASAQPTAATGIGMSAVAMAKINFEDDTSRYVVIRRAETLSTFPGMLSFPGGYMDKWGDQFYGTAMRELQEETGDWCTNVPWSDVREAAFLGSVPRPDRHNITVVVKMETSVSCAHSELLSRFVAQPGEVASVHLMTMDEMKARIDEFTPGIKKLLIDQ